MVLLMSMVLVTGCVQQTPIPSGTVQGQISQPTVWSAPVQYKDSSTFLLSRADLPQDENWTVTARGESNVNDVDSRALEYNWSGGYATRFTFSQNDQITYLDQGLSIFPEDRILGFFNTSIVGEEPLSNPLIGGNSRSTKIRTTVLGQEIVMYRIYFVKNNVFAYLQSWGTITDYLKLKELAQKAYDKIDGYGKPFDYQALQQTSKTYTNNLYGFSIIPPNRWNIDENVQENIVQFASPPVSGKSAAIRVGISDLNMSVLDAEINRKRYIDLQKQGMSNFVLLESKPLTIKGKKAYSFTFVATSANGDNIARQDVFIERNDYQVFFVEYAAYSNQFETYKDVFTETVNSFKVN